MKNIKVKLLLGIIVITAFILRFYRVSVIPPSLSWDEVSIGYNAYSILKTGRDEHQRFLPLDTFVAFGDYKPPVAIYFTVPFIYLFGLNELAIRFPSLLFGTLSILLTFFLVKELFVSDKKRENLGLIAAFVLALSPWHINISRAGFEANIATFFILLGIWFVLKARGQIKYLYVCWLPLVVAVYTFNSARYFVPMLGLGLLVYCHTLFIKNLKRTLIGILLACITMIPILPHLLSKEARLRFTEVNIFTESSVVINSNKLIAEDGNTFWSKIIHNRRVGYTISFMKHYLDHFEPSFLFLTGDGNPKFSIQDVGELYLVELPLLIIGLLYLFKDKREQAIFLGFWLLTGIIPAATARETPHALRILITLPTWQIFIAYGIYKILERVALFSRRYMQRAVWLLFILLYSFNVIFYLHNYYDNYPIEYSGEWQYGYKDAILYAELHKKDYQKIVLSDVIGRPYAYVLFYTAYNPMKFWKTADASFDAAGFYNVYGFGQYTFVRSRPDTFLSHVLYILPPEQMPVGAHVLKTISLLNGKPVLSIFEM